MSLVHNYATPSLLPVQLTRFHSPFLRSDFAEALIIDLNLFARSTCTCFISGASSPKRFAVCWDECPQEVTAAFDLFIIILIVQFCNHTVCAAVGQRLGKKNRASGVGAICTLLSVDCPVNLPRVIGLQVRAKPRREEEDEESSRFHLCRCCIRSLTPR